MASQREQTSLGSRSDVTRAASREDPAELRAGGSTVSDRVVSRCSCLRAGPMLSSVGTTQETWSGGRTSCECELRDTEGLGDDEPRRGCRERHGQRGERRQ